MRAEHYIDEEDLSVAWAKALRLTYSNRKEVAPLIVSIGGRSDGSIQETPAIREATEKLLASEGMQSVETVASTIFPHSLWNPSVTRAQLFHRYRSVLPKLKQYGQNKHGIYFQRMIDGGPNEHPNQLDHAIAMFTARDGVRRSALQVGIFNPSKDHTAAAMRGFPCLQHVTFAPSNGALNVNAFYATQYLVERGYGNYLGLCRLGAFVAHELNMPLGRLTCLVGVAQCEVAKKKVAGVIALLDRPP